MSNLKKIIVSIPQSLLEQAELIMEEEQKNRSELIREALAMYFAQKEKERIRNEMIKGYKEMSMINSDLSEEGMNDYLEDLKEYERKLDCKR
ncbi:MAG: ribbon-helix-helix protein, CopG family [Clostridiales bacterium]|jgi:CopG family transcriptional regulator/antitoxin EndoAI|nr:ribbon-helix-helix protein, CopG family [Clostridiales bacterium]